MYNPKATISFQERKALVANAVQCRLILITGSIGSGKTALAETIADLTGGAKVIDPDRAVWHHEVEEPLRMGFKVILVQDRGVAPRFTHDAELWLDTCIPVVDGFAALVRKHRRLPAVYNFPFYVGP